MTRLILGRDRPLPESPQLLTFVAALTSALTRPSPAPPAGPGRRVPVEVGSGAAPDAPDPLAAPDPLVAPDPHDVPDTSGDAAATLWAAYRGAPGRSTRDDLVLHYHPLVRAIVRRTAIRLPAHVEHSDLVQSGVFGLIEAIERYDPGRCPRFESYAAPRIRGAVLDELRALDWVPRTVRLRARDAARAQEHLTLRLRRTATEGEVADALQVAPRELRAAAPAQLVSIERLRESGDGGVVDAFTDDAPDPAAAAQEQELRRRLWRAVAQLGERDRLVVRLYYLERCTLAEIGSLLGVTESRICQLHSRLVVRLRDALEELPAS